MIEPTAGRLALILSLGLVLDTPTERVEPVTLSGRVVMLSAALKSSGLSFDTEPIAHQVVLKGADGTLTPILSDEASRGPLSRPAVTRSLDGDQGPALSGQSLHPGAHVPD